MKQINIYLNPDSISSAISQLNYIKNVFPKMVSELLMGAALIVTEKANLYIDISDIGNLVKEDIKSGWVYEPIPSGMGIIVKNTSDKSVYVEFGVGIVGQQDSHPNANVTGYEYNKDSPSKSSDGSWAFFVDSERLDLPINSLLAHNWYKGKRGKNGIAGQRLFIMTKGAKGVWYTYNAIADSYAELATGGGAIKALWESIKMRYIV
jgi:hypothetical protein